MAASSYTSGLFLSNLRLGGVLDVFEQRSRNLTSVLRRAGINALATAAVTMFASSTRIAYTQWFYNAMPRESNPNDWTDDFYQADTAPFQLVKQLSWKNRTLCLLALVVAYVAYCTTRI